MSTTLPPNPTLTPRRWWQGWSDFWFRPSDPTTLAFIRIVTGLLVLYIHLAYSLDLQAFFGKHGWYAASFVDRERRDSPVYVSPFSDWDAQVISPRLSDFPHRRQAFMEFIRGLPGDKASREAAMAYLNRANQLPNGDDFRRALVYVQQMSTRADLKNNVTVIKGGEVEDKAITQTYDWSTPDFIKSKDEAEREKIAAEIEAFWAVLPKEGNSSYRTYVFNHFIEIPPDARRALISYINDLPEDKAERDRWLDYLDYWNVDPRMAYRKGHNGFSVWFHVYDPTAMAVIHAGVIFFIVLFTLGLFTRVTSVIVWIACVGYIHRTQQVLFGMDTMMNLLLFYLMIGNSGAALSIDRLIARYRATRASLRRSGTIDANTRAFLACPPPSVGAGFGLRLIQIHVCFIYMAAGLSKLKGGSWWSGQAFWDVAVNPEFTPLHYQWYEMAMRQLSQSKPVFHLICTLGVWFTLFVEIALPFLVWTRARWFILLLATAMHAAIGVMMGLNLFELLMIVMFLAFMPDRVIRDRFRGSPDLQSLTFAFNPNDPKQAQAASLAVALDVDNQVVLAPDTTANSTAIAAPDGQLETGADGIRIAAKGFRLLSAFSWMLWIPGVKSILGRRLFPSEPAAATTASASLKPPSAAAR